MRTHEEMRRETKAHAALIAEMRRAKLEQQPRPQILIPTTSSTATAGPPLKFKTPDQNKAAVVQKPVTVTKPAAVKP